MIHIRHPSFGSCQIKEAEKVAILMAAVCLFMPLESVGHGDIHVRHYEPVFYDHVHLANKHHVTRRSVDEEIHFRFEAYGKTFSTRLKRGTSVLHPNVVVETSHQTLPYDVTRTYSGHLEGEPSHVHGIITTAGHFEGKIYTNQDTYFMERAEHIVPEHPDFHSMIYKLSDVTFNSTMTSCLHDRLRQRQLAMTRDVNKRTFTEKEEDFQTDWFRRYSNESNNNGNVMHSQEEASGERKLHRKARAIDPAKVTCELYMQADHLYYQKYGSSADTVIEKFAQYVQAINTMYTAIDFDNSGGPDSIGFVIKKIKIYTDPEEPGYKYGGPMDVEYFLDKHSEDDYDAFCLSYLFTYRDFSDGVLGLAWVGEVSSVGGGVCERHDLYNGVGKSLNTGIVTVLNYGTDIPSAVSHVTFAHEVGHNFGSPHDSDSNPVCAPGGTDGNYIMYAHATPGSMPNNNDLSSCSILSISPVLEHKARSSSGCFVAFTDAICGNRVVEGDEECDCGWSEECTEGCCNPQVVNTTGTGVPCTKKDTSVCSPSQGPCCNSSCQFINGTLCRPASDCLGEAYCNGAIAECPASAHANDTTPCGDSEDFLVCLKGECTGTVCLAYGREPCQCAGSSSESWQEPILCHVCCQDGGTCKSSFHLGDVPDAMAVSGSPCNDNGGYCDVFKKCRHVDPSGPLANLKRLFFSGEALNTMKEWLTKHWYVGVAAGVGLFIIVGLVVKFCSKSSAKRVTPSAPGPSKKTTRHYQRRSNHVTPDMWI